MEGSINQSGIGGKNNFPTTNGISGVLKKSKAKALDIIGGVGYMGGGMTALAGGALGISQAAQNSEITRFISQFPIETALTFGLISLGGIVGSGFSIDKGISNILRRESAWRKWRRTMEKGNMYNLKLDDDPLFMIKEIEGSPKDTLVVKYYYSGYVEPVNIAEKQKEVEDMLGYYPLDMIREHLCNVVIHAFHQQEGIAADNNVIIEAIKKLPSDVRSKLIPAFYRKQEQSGENLIHGQAWRNQKTLYIDPIGAHQTTVHHEMAHMTLFHGMYIWFSREWRLLFGERSADMTEYAPHALWGTDIDYGVWNVDEDMATIGEHMFSQSGWKILKERVDQNEKRGSRPGILAKKIEKMKEFYEKQSKGKMGNNFFLLIESGVIDSGAAAQKYFK